jgi:AraC-like DNA-binding protein
MFTKAGSMKPPTTAAFASRTELELYYAGRQACPPGHASGPFIREHFLLHFITVGRGRFEINGRQYLLTQGNAFLIYPGQLFYYQADPVAPWTYCWIGCNGAGAEKLLAAVGLTKDAPVYRTAHIRAVERAFDAVNRNAPKFAARRFLEKSLLFNLLDVMMVHNAQPDAEPRATGGFDLVDRAVTIMVRELDQALTIEGLAARLGVSRSHLFAAFKQHLGRSPKAHLKCLRLEKSLDYLRNPDLRIGEVARAVGYPDPLHYSKEFRRWLKQSPREYRRHSLNTQ